MDKMYILPHSHYDAEVFLPRGEYLEIGYKVVIDVLNALKSDPEYRFALDQSAYIQPFLKAYPELKEDMLEMVRSGQLEIVGGMHVMSDLNMVSGESIVRQFESGKGFFRKELGIDVKTGWMIDTFGHNAQMPQIMRKCGFDHYVFCRVADQDRSEFLWEGLDGTSISAFWMPYHYCTFCGSPGWFEGFRTFVTDQYNRLKPYSKSGHVAAAEGGDFTHPVRHDPEFVRIWNRDAKRPFDLTLATPREYLDAAFKDMKTVSVVKGELNPVFQGCYSARIRVKQQNRKLEDLLYEAEAWNAIDLRYGGIDRSQYILDAWEPVLFNQVHDVMGGVQTDRVFENVQKRWNEAGYLADLVLEGSLDRIIERADTRSEGIPLAVMNPLCWDRTDKAYATVGFDSDDVFSLAVADSAGTAVPAQADVLERYPNGAIRQAKLLFIAKCPALGYEVYHVLKNGKSPHVNMWKTGKAYGMEELDKAVLENEFYRIECDPWKGTITSLVLKKTGQEYIDPDMPYGNMLVRDEDNGDFWEIGAPLRAGSNRPAHRLFPLDIHKINTELSIDKGGTFSVTEGDVCMEFKFVQSAGCGDIATHVRLHSGLPLIEVETSLVNRDKNVRYRVAFPTAIKNGVTTHEIPFGSIERPEGEYPALNWADYSVPGYGLTLFNCGIPGNATVDGKMMLSVMKCTGFVSYSGGGYDPDNSAEGGFEIGVPHVFRYALMPHDGNWRDAGLTRRGMEFNHPLIARKASSHKGDMPSRISFVKLCDQQTVSSCVRSFSHGLMLRVWEPAGRAASGVRVDLTWKIMTVEETDMLGVKLEKTDPVSADEQGFIFDLKPYEVRTFI
ncbi:MAG: glycoside hydrolase family 38 C-terminal domain-containing protein, partial [Clostridia bacterium]